MSAKKQGSHTALYRVLMAAMLALVSFAAQAGGFDGRFTARTGDLNGDGRTDVYLKWSPRVIPISFDDISIPIPMTRRQIPDFVLQQAASGTFTIVSSLSGAQLGALSSWPRATGVELVPGDVNYDGTLDLIVRKLTTAISGVDANQVIIASPTANAAPVDVKALTSDMKSFYKQVTQWYMSPEITETLYALVWSYYGYLNYYDPIFCASFVACQIRLDDVDDPNGNWPSDDPFSPNVYHYFGASLVPYATQTYHDYSITDPTAYQFASAFYPMDRSGEIRPGAAGTVTMHNILTALWAGQQHVNLTRQPTGDAESDVKDHWNWVKVLEHLSRIYYEVCIADGREAVNCFRDYREPRWQRPWVWSTRRAWAESRCSGCARLPSTKAWPSMSSRSVMPSSMVTF